MYECGSFGKVGGYMAEDVQRGLSVRAHGGVLYEGGRAEGCGNNYVLRCVINIMNKRLER